MIIYRKLNPKSLFYWVNYGNKMAGDRRVWKQDGDVCQLTLYFYILIFSSKLFSPPDKSNIVTVILWFKCVKVLVQWCYWDNGNHFSATGGDILKNKMALTVLMTRVDAGRRPSVTYNEGFWVAATGFIWRMSVLSCGLVLLLIFRVSLWFM